jgi:hypothetical protein
LSQCQQCRDPAPASCHSGLSVTSNKNTSAPKPCAPSGLVHRRRLIPRLEACFVEPVASSAEILFWPSVTVSFRLIVTLHLLPQFLLHFHRRRLIPRLEGCFVELVAGGAQILHRPSVIFICYLLTTLHLLPVWFPSTAGGSYLGWNPALLSP